MFALRAQPGLSLVHELAISDLLERQVQQGFVVPAVVDDRGEILIDDFVVVWEGVGRDEVAPANFGAVDLEFPGSQVQHAFDHEHAVLSSRAAIGCHDGLVGEDRRELAVVIADVVQPQHVGLRVERHGQAIRSIRAGVVQEDVVHAEDVAVPVEGDLGVMDLTAFVRGGHEILGTVFDPFDRLIQPHSCPGNQYFLLVEHHDLRPEPAADERRDHPHLPLREPKHSCQAVANHDRSLGCVPDG